MNNLKNLYRIKLEKNFRAQNPFTTFSKFCNKKRKIKVVFRTHSGKKICNVKFSKEEFSLIEKAAEYEKQTINEFFAQMLTDIVNK